MPVEFVGREIDVRLSDDEEASPAAFRLGGREYKVAERIATWEEAAFGGRQRGRDWREQQQRRFYRLRTEDGEVYELYADWSPARRRRKAGGQGVRWYLHRRLTSAAAEEKAEPEPQSEPEPETEPETEPEARPPSGRRRSSAPSRPRRGG